MVERAETSEILEKTELSSVCGRVYWRPLFWFLASDSLGITRAEWAAVLPDSARKTTTQAQAFPPGESV